MDKNKYTFLDFVNIMERLSAPDGCPWDRVQTHDSLKRYMIEECYEAIEAIDNRDTENLCEELGDVMLQVVFHAVLAQKEGIFDIGDVIDGICTKMINRHRHIFGDVVANTPDDVLKSWDEIKKEEKNYKNKTEQLRSIPKSLPALMRCEKVVSKAEKLMGVSENVEDLYKNAEDILEELKAGNNAPKQQKLDNIGKILLLLVNISRKSEINPEFALTNAVETYINRFECIENTSVSEFMDEDTQTDD